MTTRCRCVSRPRATATSRRCIAPSVSLPTTRPTVIRPPAIGQALGSALDRERLGMESETDDVAADEVAERVARVDDQRREMDDLGVVERGVVGEERHAVDARLELLTDRNGLEMEAFLADLGDERVAVGEHGALV